MKTIPRILMGATDFKGRCIHANDVLLSEMGYESKKDIIGRHEYDIGQEVFGESIEGAELLVSQFLEEDEMVFRGKELHSLYVQRWRGKIKFRIAFKFPYKNEKGKIYAAMYHSSEIINPSIQLLNSYLTTKQEDLNISDQSRKHIQWYIDELHSSLILSHRELECINFLAKGFTAKEIARELNLSYRTIESHLESARNKLGCYNGLELIAKCFAKGWLEIPKKFAGF